MTDIWLLVGIGSGIISVGAALFLYYWVMRQDAGSERAREVARWIREGAASYLRRLYIALTLVSVVLGFIIAIVVSLFTQSHPVSRLYGLVYRLKQPQAEGTA